MTSMCTVRVNWPPIPSGWYLQRKVLVYESACAKTINKATGRLYEAA